MDTQQTPHVPPLRASHGTSTLSYMDIECSILLGFYCIYFQTHHSNFKKPPERVAQELPYLMHQLLPEHRDRMLKMMTSIVMVGAMAQ